MVTVRTDGEIGGQQAAVITSVHPRGSGAISEWINKGKDRENTLRTLVYADKFQASEIVTGRLNPENANPAFMGRDFVSSLGEINTSDATTKLATSPISDKPTIVKQGSPVNSHYRGFATVATKLQQHLTGKGLPKVKTRDDLTRWID